MGNDRVSDREELSQDHVDVKLDPSAAVSRREHMRLVKTFWIQRRGEYRESSQLKERRLIRIRMDA
jgi:hypothetical protein